MNNIEKYNAAFVESFGVTAEQLPGLVYPGTYAVDCGAGGRFNILFGTDDIIDFNSYEKGKDPLNYD